MPTPGQATYIHQNINSFVALVFIASFAGGMALVVWHASVGNNPIADFITQTVSAQTLSQ